MFHSDHIVELPSAAATIELWKVYFTYSDKKKIALTYFYKTRIPSIADLLDYRAFAFSKKKPHFTQRQVNSKVLRIIQSIAKNNERFFVLFCFVCIAKWKSGCWASHNGHTRTTLRIFLRKIQLRYGKEAAWAMSTIPRGLSLCCTLLCILISTQANVSFIHRLSQFGSRMGHMV